jgi:hypothetical protein
MIRLPAAATLVLAMVAPGHAAAAEWHYCVAILHTERTAYVTDAFRTTTGTSAIESEFARFLDNGGLSHDDVQCPRADSEPSAQAMQQHTEAYNQTAGNKVVGLQWRPTK